MPNSRRGAARRKADAGAMFRRILTRHGPGEIADRLSLHPNTVKRWIEQGRVPPQYTQDFMRMLGRPAREISRQLADPVRDKDQYYTKPEAAKRCFEVFQKAAKQLQIDLRRYHFIEPSAGCGWFYRLLPPKRRTGVDIDPGSDAFGASEKLVTADFLQWRPRQNGKARKFAVIGNPPFGLRGHLALQFLNHASEFADLTGFVLPQLFASRGKGVPGKRVRNYQLAHTEEMPPNSFRRSTGEDIDISTVFQVWTKVGVEHIARVPEKTCWTYAQVVSLSDGGTPASTRNKALIGKCDIYLPSTCYGGMRAYADFEELPHRRGYGVILLRSKREIGRRLRRHPWEKTAFRSTNSALNLRRDLIEKVIIEHGYFD